MWASKIGSCAAAGSGAVARSAAVSARAARRIIAGILPPSFAGAAALGRRVRPADAARPVAHAPRVGDRGEDHAVRLGDALLVRAAAPADDARGRAPDERPRRALERQQLRLPAPAERLVAPPALAPG